MERKSSEELKRLINKAIDDHAITNAEYDHILHLADADGHVDAEERALLKTLHDMIQDGSVKRTGRA